MSAAQAKLDDAIGYIEKTIDNAEGGTYSWGNDEVVQMLVEIHEMLIRVDE